MGQVVSAGEGGRRGGGRYELLSLFQTKAKN